MYRAPVGEIGFTLLEVAGLRQALEGGLFPDLTPDVVEAVLAEAGRFAGERIAPLARIGDEQGAGLQDGRVTTPDGWKELYAAWRDAGWNGLSAPAEWGGQGLPIMLAIAAYEMWNAGAMAFAVGPTLTMGAVEALAAHGSPALKGRFLPKLVSGDWMGTMNLTEPQAGSDLSGLRVRAERAEDGSYRLHGQKIFITYGEHDWTDNIVHLVLARLPDAPAGTRGISLFLVPKMLVGEDGALGARNAISCAGLEKKLGIHASPTCTMVFGDGSSGAAGYLVGEENRGLACMFTMMNNARLAIGIQGVGVAEAAFQKALAYARERRQGRAGAAGTGPIAGHPDVQRMLLTMQALTEAARAICYACAHAIDCARLDTERRAFWQNRAGLLTPVAKAFATDAGVEVASLGIQVHGGMGYVEETGAARLYRDARIAPIYEGTNGIQAIDLVTRKLPLDGGRHVHGFLDGLRAEAKRLAEAGPADCAGPLADAVEALARTTAQLQAWLAEGETERALAGATPYLASFGLVTGAALMARGALADPARAPLLAFTVQNLLPETVALERRILHGSASLLAAGRRLLADAT